MRQGKTEVSHLQMLDEQSRLSEMSRDPLPADSIKNQLESLIAALGYESHKSEAVVAENNEQDRKHIDEYYESVQRNLEKEKDKFSETIRKEHRAEINDLQLKDEDNCREIQALLQKIKMLEREIEEMKQAMHQLRLKLEQERDIRADAQLKFNK